MALEDYDIEKADVALPNGSTFSVRGLSLADIAPLISKRRPQIEAFFIKYAGKDTKIKNKTAASIAAGAMVTESAMELLTVAPELAAEIIANAADRAHLLPKIMALPITVQIEALTKIATLTFDAAGGPGNFFAALTQVIGGTTDLLSSLNRSRIGSSAFAGK